VSFKLRKVRDVTILDINCSLDEQRDYLFKEYADQFISQKLKALVLNFENCDYINSCAIGVIFTCISEFRNFNGQIKLLNVKNNLEKWFKEIKLDSVVKIYDTEKKCLESFSKLNS
jgi:anti-anti-sigma factor